MKAMAWIGAGAAAAAVGYYLYRRSQPVPDKVAAAQPAMTNSLAPAAPPQVVANKVAPLVPTNTVIDDNSGGEFVFPEAKPIQVLPVVSTPVIERPPVATVVEAVKAGYISPAQGNQILIQQQQAAEVQARTVAPAPMITTSKSAAPVVVKPLPVVVYAPSYPGNLARESMNGLGRLIPHR